MSDDLFKKVTKQSISAYQERLANVLKLSPATVNRRISALRKFCAWAEKEGYLKENPFALPKKEIKRIKVKVPRYLDKLRPSIPSIPYLGNAYKIYQSIPITNYLHYAVLIIFCAALGFGFYQQFFARAPEPLAFPAEEIRPNRFLSFQGRLTDSSDNPISEQRDFVFKLYDAASGGNTLWDSGTCQVTPDQDGIFAVILGTSSGSGYTCSSALEIDSWVFSENAEVWLGVKIAGDDEATPRIQIATVAYALNTETLQGFPLASQTDATPEATMGATARTVPALNPAGNLVIAATSPTLWSTSGTFAIKGQALSIVTDTGTGGNIAIDPDSTGKLNITLGGATGNQMRVTDANITGDALVSVYAGTPDTGFDLLNLSSGSSETTVFSVDESGNTYAAGTVGIGTTNPGTSLDVVGGSIRTNADIYGGDLYLGYDDTSATITTSDNENLTLDPNSTGDIFFHGSTYYIDDSSLAYLYGLATTGYTPTAGEIRADIFRDGNSNYYIQPADTTTAGIFAGNVGIGTTDPGVSLHVDTTSSLKVSYAPDNAYYSTLNWNILEFYGQRGYINYSSAQDVALARGGGDVAIGAEDPGTAKLYVDGNVGIGTTGPAMDLDIAGDATLSGTLSLGPQVEAYAGTCDPSSEGMMYYDAGQNSYYYCNGSSWTQMGAGGGTVGGSGTDNYIPKWSDSSTLTDSIIYETASKIGIGTTNPGTQLHITGDLTIDGGDIAGADDESIDIGEATANTIQLFIDATSELTLTADYLQPTINAGLSLGGASYQWNDLYVDGLAYIDGLGEDLDAGNFDITSVDRLQGLDAGLFIDMGQNSQILIYSDGGGTPFSSPDIDITGSVYFDDHIGLPSGKQVQFADAGEYIVSNGADLTIVSGDDIILSPTGNVGIGTTAPSALLSVGPTSQFQVNSSGAITAVASITVSQDGDIIPATTTGTSDIGSSSIPWDNVYADNYYKGSTALGLWLDAGAYIYPENVGTTFQIADTSGNLTVPGTASFNSAGVTIDASSYVNAERFVDMGSNYYLDPASTTISLVVATNVGIGTTSPLTKFHVDGTTIGKALVIFDEAGTNDILTASVSGQTKFTLASSGTITTANGAWDSDVADSSAAIGFTLDTNNSLTTQGAKLLSVQNNTTEMFYIDKDGNLYAAGTITAGEGQSVLITNKSGGTVSQYSLVIADSSNDNAFTTTTTAHHKKVIGVVVGVGLGVSNDDDEDGNCDADDNCMVAVGGKTTINAANAVTRGDYLYSSTTAAKAKASSILSDGLIGVALTGDAVSLYQVDVALVHDLSSAGDAAFFTQTDESVADGSYVEVSHNGGTNDLLASAWVYNTSTNQWEDVTQATASGQIQDIVGGNLVKNYPSLELANGAQPEWWEEQDANITLTEEDASGESIAQKHERVLKIVNGGSGANKYIYQDFDTNDEPTLDESVTKVSSGVWVYQKSTDTAGTITLDLYDSGASTSLGTDTTTSQDTWVFLKVENVTIEDNTQIRLSHSANSAIFYAAMPQLNIGPKVSSWTERGLKYVEKYSATVMDKNPSDDNWHDLDFTSITSPLTAKLNIGTYTYNDTTTSAYSYIRRNGSSEGQTNATKVAYVKSSLGYKVDNHLTTLCDDSQIIEESVYRSDVLSGWQINLIGYWEWGSGSPGVAAEPFQIVQSDNNTVRLYNYSGTIQNLRLDVTAAGAGVHSGLYTNANSSLADGSYLDVAHNQNTNDLISMGWIYDGAKWVEIDDHAGTSHSTQDPNLTSWYRTEEASGDLDNAEGTATRDLIDKGSPTYQQTGRVNYSVDLDGTSDYFCSGSGTTCADNDDFDFTASDDFSIGGWFKHDTIATNPDYLVTKTGLDYGDGADGAITVSTNKNINTDPIASGRTVADGEAFAVSSLTSNTITATGTGTDGTAATSLSSSIDAGDEVILINLQGSSGATTNVGSYEFCEVSYVSSATINCVYNLKKTYGESSNTDLTGQKIVVQRVPNYTNVAIDNGITLNANDWGGTYGGLLIFRASGTVTVTGTINMAGKGYRGYNLSHSNSNWGSDGRQGESYGGGSGTVSNSANLGGGGGGDRDGAATGGGGGGGFGTVGAAGDGGLGGDGGGTYGSTDSIKLFIGSAGGSGAGWTNNGAPDSTSNTGGDGGGSIIIIAATFTNDGTVTASGAQGSGSRAGYSGYGGPGGGSGGQIIFQTETFTNNSTVTATGADGLTCSSGYGCSDGGDGGDGRIRNEYTDSSSGSTNPAASSQQIPGVGYKLYMENDGDLTFAIDDDNTSFPEDSATTTVSTYDNNAWHHMVAVKSGTSYIKLYIDGQEVASDTSISADGPLDNSGEFYLGVDSDESSNKWDGTLDEMFVYGRALTPGEVEELYRSNARFYMEQADSNTVRLYNYTGLAQNVRMDVIVGGIDNPSQGTVSLHPESADVDTEADGSSIWINKTGSGGNLLRLQASGTDEFVVDASGNLTIDGNIVPAQDDTFDLGSSSSYWQDLYLTGATIYFDDTNDATIAYDTSAGEFQFDPDGDGTPNVVFEDGGNVGIGTTGPTAELDIAGDASASGSLVFRAASPTIDILNGADLSFQTSVGGDTGLSPVMTIDNSGNVGIGTTDPAQKLTLSQGIFLNTSGGTPTVKGSINAGNLFQAVYVSGKYAYGAFRWATNEFEIIDVSDPANPTTISGVDFGTDINAHDVKVSGKYAYLGNETVSGTCSGATLTGCEFRIYDISNPSSIAAVGGLDLGITVQSIYISGKYAYIGTDSISGNDFRIIDISNPSNLVEVGGVDIGVGVNSIFVSVKYAYIANRYVAGTCSGTTLTGCEFRIYDISNPTSPSAVGGADLDADVYDVYISGKYAYLGQYIDGVGTCSGATVDDCGLVIYNVSDPSSPTVVGGTLSGIAASVQSLQVAGQYAYIGRGDGSGNEFKIVDISTPSAPVEVGGVDVGIDVYSVFISGKYAYTAMGYSASVDEFQIYDISGIDAPTASIGTLAANFLDISENAIINNNLYVRNGLNVGPGGLYVDAGEVAFDSNSGDTAFKITQKGTGDILNIFDNTTEVFTILNGGNVGIGTTDPSEELEVNGDAYISDHLAVGTNGAIGTDRIIDVDETFTTDGDRYGMVLEPTFAFTAGADRNLTGLSLSTEAYITESGNDVDLRGLHAVSTVKSGYTANDVLGVYSLAIAQHTTSTVDSLQGVRAVAVNDSTGTVIDARGVLGLVQNDDGTINNAYGGQFEILNDVAGGTIDNAYGAYSHIYENAGTVTTGYGFYANCDDAATCYGLYIAAGDAQVTTDWGVYVTGEDNNYFSGNVGIGTTAPGTELSIDDGGGISGTPSIEFNDRAYVGYDGSSGDEDFAFLQGVAGKGLALQTDGSNTRLFINSSGNIGIGTTDPSHKLHFYGTTEDENFIFAESTENTWGAIKLQAPNQTGIGFYSTNYDDFHAYNNYGDFVIWNATDSRTGLQIQDDGDVLLASGGGNVGIGTTNPSYKLEVIGTGYFSDHLRLASSKQIQFADTGEYITSDGTDLSLASGEDILLVSPLSAPNTLFNVRHETGDLSEYDYAKEDSGDLSVHTDAALAGSGYGLKAVMDDDGDNEIYGEKDFASYPASGKLRWRFYFDPNGLTHPGGSGAIYIFGLYLDQSPWWFSAIRLYHDGSNYEISATAHEDDGTWMDTSTKYDITDAEHYIEVYLTRASSDIADDGTLSLYIDGTFKETVINVDNYDNWLLIDNITIGSLGDAPSTFAGTFYLDELEANDDGSEIGPASKVGIATASPAYTLDVAGAINTNALYAAGRVGIGTTDPGSYNLNVNGTAAFNSAGVTIDASSYVNAERFVDMGSNYYLDPASTTIAGLFAGNVGIGTTSPGGLLGLSDANTYIDVDGSNNLTFTDANAGTYQLKQITKNMYAGHTEVSIANSTTETTLFSTTIPGGTLGTDNILRIHVFFSLSNWTGSNRDAALRLKYGSETVNTRSWSQGYNFSGYMFDGEIFLFGNGGTTSQKSIWNTMITAKNASTATAILGGSGTATQDSTQDKTLELTFQWGYAHQDLQFHFYGATVELLFDPPQGADVAEWYPTLDTSIEAGDVVSVDPENDVYIKKSEKAYDSTAIGIIATQPGAVLGEHDENSRMVALVGRVPTKVTLEGGEIMPGDHLTSSSTLGYAMKATKPGPIIGIALEPYTGESEEDKVMTFVNVSWYDPQVFLTDTGDLNITPVATGEGQIEDNKQFYQLTDAAGEIIDRVGAFAKAAIAELRAGLIETQELITNSLTVKEKLVSPLVETQEIKTERISLKEIEAEPGEDIVFNLQEATESGFGPSTSSEFGRLIIKGKEGEEVASIDAEGNATFAGELHARKIVAEEIVGLKGKFGELIAATVSAEKIQGLEERLALLEKDTEETYETEVSPSPTPSPEPEAEEEPAATESGEIDVLADIEAMVDEILNSSLESFPQADLTDISGEDLKIANSLTVLGTTSLADTSVAGNLSVDGTLTISGNSIDTLTETLYLQSLGLGGVDILAGKIVINEQGNMTVEGNVTIKGSLFANIISPLPEQDIVIDLKQKALDETQESDFGKLIVKGVEGEVVASIEASGTATFKKLAIAKAEEEVTQVSETEIETNATAGETALLAGETEITIKSQFVTDKTMVYVTPTSDSQNKVLFVKAKKGTTEEEMGWFKVGIDVAIDSDIEFNWWIIN